MDLQLAGRAVLVTGAASGIGLACARALVAEGAYVGLVDRDASALTDLVRALSSAGGQVHAAVADVTDELALRAAIDDTARTFGALDAVVGCAGISGPVGTTTDAVPRAGWDEVFAVNVVGQFLLAKHALPWLLRSDQASVVFLASDSAFVAARGMAPYCASKGALVSFTRALSVDVADSGVRVNCVCPSVVDTPMARDDLGVADFGAAEFPVQPAAWVADQVLFLTSVRSRPVNGQAIVSDFGYTARSAFPA